MNTITLILLAFSMAMDAFTANIAKGASTTERLPLPHIIKTAGIFGVMETISPLIGWGIGATAMPFVHEIDHWIAFVLLCILGARMIHASLRNNPTPINNNGATLTFITAIATSIDSMVMGVSLAFLSVNIWFTALAIGTATALMSAVGLILGRILGAKIGKWAEFLGGLMLIGIGSSILVSHLQLL